jgi:4a-hydroxytetrahydrobiopterin dehydratase
MAEFSRDRLDDAAVKSRLGGLPGWAVEGGMLVREFTFESYAAGLVFACACGQVAEELDHHPDLFVGYRKVRVAFSTHSAGGLTEYDFEAARRVGALA